MALTFNNSTMVMQKSSLTAQDALKMRRLYWFRVKNRSELKKVFSCSGPEIWSVLLRDEFCWDRTVNKEPKRVTFEDLWDHEEVEKEAGRMTTGEKFLLKKFLEKHEAYTVNDVEQMFLIKKRK